MQGWIKWLGLPKWSVMMGWSGWLLLGGGLHGEGGRGGTAGWDGEGCHHCKSCLLGLVWMLGVKKSSFYSSD